MADDDKDKAARTFTEGEAYALVAAAVQRETAEMKTALDTAVADKAATETKLELADAALATEKAARETAVTDLATFKASAETEREQAARRDGRVAKVRETAGHLKDEFFTDERALRWSAMDDAAFDSYIAELALVSTGAPGADGKTADGKTDGKTDSKGTPRETAMGQGGTGSAGDGQNPNLLNQLLRGPTSTASTGDTSADVRKG